MECISSRKWIRSHGNEYALPELLMRLMFTGPEDTDKCWRILGILYQIPGAMVGVIVFIYVWTDASSQGAITIARSLTDVILYTTLSIKLIFIYRGKHKVSALRSLVNEEFRELENRLNLDAVRKKRPFWPWIPTTMFSLQIITSFVVIAISTTLPREERDFVIHFPSACMRDDHCYWVGLIIFVLNHITYWTAYATSDALYICSTGIIQDKSATLVQAIKNLKYCKGNHQISANLSDIVRYHQLIIKLKVQTGSLCSGPALGQVLSVLLALGTFIIHLVYDEIPRTEAFFALFYTGWILGQLSTYCFLGDSVTATAEWIPRAAYNAYQPTMDKQSAEKLKLLILCSQKPLKLTAMGLLSFSRRSFLEVLKKSYSSFSTLLRLKN